jgi:hypothetical protein
MKSIVILGAFLLGVVSANVFTKEATCRFEDETYINGLCVATDDLPLVNFAYPVPVDIEEAYKSGGIQEL